MSYPQQPGGWSDPSWPTPNEPYQDPGHGSYQAYAEYVVPLPPGPAYGPAQPPYGYGIPPAPKTNGLAIASMIVSLSSFGFCGLSGIVGAIMGHIARQQIRETREAGDGMAVTGIVVGWILFSLFALGVGLVILSAAYDGN